MARTDQQQALKQIARQHRSMFLPQVEQLGLETRSVRFGFLADADNPQVNGWFWAGSIGEHCLITTMRLTNRRRLELVEEPDIGGYCVSLLSNCCARALDETQEENSGPKHIGRPSRAPIPSAEHEQVRLFETTPSECRYPLGAGDTFNSCSIVYFPEYFDDLERRYPGEFAGVREAIADKLDCSQSLELLSLLRRINPYHANQPGALAFFESAAQQALVAVANTLANRRASQTGQSSSDEALVERAKSLIALSIEQPPTLDELAELLFVSRTRLCTCFKEITGKSIGDYRTQVRLQRARELLGESDLAYATVARMVGYRHQSTFCAMFKQACGVTPQQWREGVRA